MADNNRLQKLIVRCFFAMDELPWELTQIILRAVGFPPVMRRVCKQWRELLPRGAHKYNNHNLGVCLIERHHITLLKWAHSEGYPVKYFSYLLSTTAVKTCSIETLEWIDSIGCELDMTCDCVAVRCGHIEVLTWLILHDPRKFYYSDSLLDISLFHDQFATAKHILETVSPKERAGYIEYASMCGYTAWLIENGYKN